MVTIQDMKSHTILIDLTALLPVPFTLIRRDLGIQLVDLGNLGEVALILGGLLAAIALFAWGIRYFEIRRFRSQIALLRQQQALEKERLRISRDMHDEVGSNLTRIAILSELALRNLAKPEDVREQIEEISRMSREAVDSIGEIIWALNPGNNTLDNLAAYIRYYSARCFEYSDLNCHLDFPEELPADTISAELRRDLFWVVKESLHNIIKHSCAREVYVGLQYQKQTVQLTIRDNGKGFDGKCVSRFSTGIGNMKKRIADAGGSFSLNSDEQSGTEITVAVKL